MKNRIYIFSIFAAGLLFLFGCSDETESDPISRYRSDSLFFAVSDSNYTYNPQLEEGIWFPLYDLDGNKRGSTKDFYGNVVILNFWATWTPESKKELPMLQKLHKKYSEEDLIIAAVNMDADSEEVKKFLKDHILTFPFYYDIKQEAGNNFNVSSLPCSYVISRTGEVKKEIIDAGKWNSSEIEALIDTLLSQ